MVPAIACRGKGKGTAAVVFATADEAREAIPLLNGTRLAGAACWQGEVDADSRREFSGDFFEFELVISLGLYYKWGLISGHFF